MIKKTVPIAEAAQILSVSLDTIRRWEKKGLIKASRDINNARIFDVAELKRAHDKYIGGEVSTKYKVLKTSKKTPYKTVELFAGAGGLALGLENAGLRHELLVEIDKNAAETLKKNRPKWNVKCEDAREVSYKNVKADIVTGGFPCQAFSFAGKKLGFEDARGTLFFELARAIKEIKPKIAVGENVKGLLRHENGKTLSAMIDIMDELGYRVVTRVLRAQYLDVPKSDGQTYPDKKKKILAKIPPGGYWRDLPDKLQREYMGASYFMGGGKTGMARRLSWDEPSLTLTCAPAQKQTERCHPDETRPLTIREYARIQSFPDTWEFIGASTSQYKQIGNAVPVNLGFHLGKCLIAMLDGSYDPKTMQYVTEAESLSAKELAIQPDLFEAETI